MSHVYTDRCGTVGSGQEKSTWEHDGSGREEVHLRWVLG